MRLLNKLRKALHFSRMEEIIENQDIITTGKVIEKDIWQDFIADGFVDSNHKTVFTTPYGHLTSRSELVYLRTTYGQRYDIRINITKKIVTDFDETYTKRVPVSDRIAEYRFLGLVD